MLQHPPPSHSTTCATRAQPVAASQPASQQARARTDPEEHDPYEVVDQQYKRVEGKVVGAGVPPRPKDVERRHLDGRRAAPRAVRLASAAALLTTPLRGCLSEVKPGSAPVAVALTGGGRPRAGVPSAHWSPAGAVSGCYARRHHIQPRCHERLGRNRPSDQTLMQGSKRCGVQWPQQRRWERAGARLQGCRSVISRLARRNDFAPQL